MKLINTLCVACVALTGLLFGGCVSVTHDSKPDPTTTTTTTTGATVAPAAVQQTTTY